MTTRIKLRRDTAANWTATNPILAAGEPGLETDTGKIKYGDGQTAWELLPHSGGDALTNDGDITVQTGDVDRWFVRLRREDSNSLVYTGVKVHSTNYDSDGNVLVVAQVNLDQSGVAAFKFTAGGELIWKKSIGTYDNTYAISSNSVVDSDDNLLFTLSQDSNVAIVVKVNGSTGAVMFSNTLDFDIGYNVRAIGVDSNDNIIIGGDINLNNYTTAFVAKLNPTATGITWQKTFTGDSSDTYLHSLAVDFNNDVVVTGSAEIEYMVDGNSTTGDVMMVAKVRSAGTLAWQKHVALESITPYGTATGVSLDSIGNIYVTGSYYVDNPAADIGPFSGNRKSNAIVVFKMTTMGVMVWDRRVGPGPCSWVGVSTAVGDDGDLYLYAGTYEYNPLGNVEGDSAGYYTTRLVLARYNKTTGAIIWQSYFDNPNAQDIPGDSDFNGPWSAVTTDLMTVKGDKILIGGAVRFGQSDVDLATPWDNPRYFNQGFLAQFDTDATKFSADGWTLTPSRIPGKLTNTLVATAGTAGYQEDVNMNAATPATIAAGDAGISVRRMLSKVNTWTFGKDGTFTAPADSNIRLQQTQLGYATLYGLWQNTDDAIWYQSVCHDTEGNTYTLGSNNWGDQVPYIQKFSPEGESVWLRQIRSGSGAAFFVAWTDGVYNAVNVDSNGSGYRVGDRIVLPGSQLNGTTGVNSLVLEVASLDNATDFVGSVATVDIVSGVANGTGNASFVQDGYDNAEGSVRSMAFDPVTGNIVIVVTNPTFNGDAQDNEWAETVVMLIDSGSGAVLSTTTLSGNGDLLGKDVAVSVTGKPAVVGQQYGVYNNYGTITPLVGSSLDKLWVAKSDIDTEHFPGEAGGNYSDWWIYGTGITGQTPVTNVNYYAGLTGTTRQGSGATFDIINNGNGTYSAGTVNSGTNYLPGHKIKILGTSLTGAENTNLYTSGVEYTVGQVAFAGTGGIFAPWYVSVNSTLTSITSLITTGTTLTLTLGGTTTSTSVVATAGEFEGSNVYEVGDLSSFGTSGTSLDSIRVGLGTYAAGATPDNDIVITVQTVGAGGGITGVGNNGTAAGTATATATAVTGTNLDVGSGANFYIYFNPTTGAINSSGINTNSGENYVTGDVITIPGTSFAGGTTTTNITVTVDNLSGTAIADPQTFSGAHPTTHLLLATSDSIDFGSTGTFSIKQNLGSEAFVWTPDFNKAMGGNNTDEFKGVVWNSTGTHLYAVGNGRYDVNYQQGLVVKYSSTGTLVASKYINGGMADDSAYQGAVALMANDSIVTVHEMYNDQRDETDEVLVTKLDSNLNILWQQFIGWYDGDSWSSPDSDISVAVDDATDEILLVWETYEDGINGGDDAVVIVKLDTDGEILWKRLLSVYESDVNMSWNDGNKGLSIHGNQFTVVGNTDAPADNTENAYIVTLPLDGTGTGLHGIWAYTELDDTRVRVQRTNTTATVFTPGLNNNQITATTNIKYYYADEPEYDFTYYTSVIRSNEGGAVEFSDGSKQTFSTSIIPQVRIGENRYTLRAEDSGRHILVDKEYDYDIIIPNWQKVKLPVGYTVTIINTTNETVNIQTESSNDYRGEIWFSGGDDKTPRVGIADNGSGQMVTLVKIKEGEISDDGDNHGDIWMIAGADISNND